MSGYTLSLSPQKMARNSYLVTGQVPVVTPLLPMRERRSVGSDRPLAKRRKIEKNESGWGRGGLLSWDDRIG